MNDIDPFLHPILCPCIVLCVMIINGRSYTLDCMNFGHHERQVICKSLLPLFHTGVLRSGAYTVHHLCTLVGLVGSFRAQRILQPDYIEQVKVYSDEMKEVLNKLQPKVWEYHDLRKICLDTLALTEEEAKVRNKKHGPIMTTAGVLISEETKQFKGQSSTSIVSMVKQHLDQTKVTKPELVTVDDIEYLLYGSCEFNDHVAKTFMGDFTSSH